MTRNYYHRPPGDNFRNSREAFHVLALHVRDDIEWFGEVTDETRELARQVVKRYLRGKTTRPAARQRMAAFGKAGRAMRFEGVA